MANHKIARAGSGPRLGKLGRSRLARAIALGILIGGTVAAPAQAAATSVWTGAVSDDWIEIGNWVVPPTSGSFVLIDALAPHSARLGTVVDVGAMTVGDHAQGALTIGAGGQLSVLGSRPAADPSGSPLGLVIAEAPGSQGTVRVDGAGATLIAEYNTLIGNGGNGTLAIANGGTARLGLDSAYAETVVGFGYYGWGDSGAGVGHVSVDGAGSSLVYAGGLNLLNGTVDVTDGGQLVSVRRAVDGTTFWVDGIGFGLPASGSFPGLAGAAKVSVRGEGSAWTSANALDIGIGGPGTLEVADGATASFKGYAILGAQAQLYNQDGTPTGLMSTGAGTLLVSGDGSRFTVDSDPDGGRGNLRIGYTGAGAARVDFGASAAVAGIVVVGERAAGTLDVTDGGTVHVAGSDANGMGLVVGDVAGSSGAVTVAGAGSSLVVDAGAQIGDAGTGSLAVLDGGHASIGLTQAYSEIVAGFGYYGWGAGAAQGRGSIAVSGEGSLLEYGGGLNLLNGEVTIADGGKLQNVVRDGEGGWLDLIGFGVPADPDPAHHFAGLRGTSSVSVVGEGSAWNSANGLQVGYGGDGSLAVRSGAEASFQGNVFVGDRSYLFDSIGGAPVPGVAPQAGTGKLVVADAGSSLVIAAGLGSDGKLVVGRYGSGVMEVAGGASASVASTLTVGENATGSLGVTGGSRMDVLGTDASRFGGIVGASKGASGTVTVGGAGSELSLAGGLQLGSAGNGSLSVTDGGVVNAGLGTRFSETVLGFGNYGWAAGAESGRGTLAVSGAGSVFNYAGGLNVLNGAVTVSNGGSLSSQRRAVDGTAFWSDIIGFGVPADPSRAYPGLLGTGAVTITGAGSTWASVNGLNVGYGGNGALSVLGGAKASFIGYAELGKLSYLYDAPDGAPVPGLAGLAGTGTLLVSGAGSSFALSAIAGNTTWGTGVLELGSEGAGSATVNNGGAISAAGGILVGVQGRFTVGGVQGGTRAAPGTVTAPWIALAAPTATLAFDHSAIAHDSSAYVFAPAISGSGRIDVAAGFTMLTGDSSAFAGDTAIGTGATLSVNGSLGGDISVDGRLQGTGTVGNVTVNSGGVLAPGNSPGTLHVDGDLVMQTGSTYAAEIDADTGLADSVAVAGNVTISTGTVLSISNLGTQPLTPGANLQLIQTVGEASTVQGQFDSVVGGSELLDFGVTYENGQIQVSAERSATTSFASVAGAGFGGLGAALDGIADDSALTRLVFTQVTTAAAAAALVEDMAGTMHADLRRVMLEDSRYARTAIGERLQDDAASGGVAWARAMGGSASADGNDALPGATVDHSGIMVGYDTAVGATRLGVAIGTDRGRYEADGKDASANLYSRHLSLYGRSQLGGLRLGYGVAFGATDAKAERAFDIGSERQFLSSKHEARTTQGFVDLGYRYGGGNSFRYVEPFLNLARVQVKDDATTEEGSVAALEIAAGDTSATFGTIGLRWNADMGGADFAGSIGWRHAFGFDGARATQAFVAGGPSFAIDSLPVDDAVVVDLGTRFRLSERARVWFGYNGMMAGSAQDHGVKLQFNLDL